MNRVQKAAVIIITLLLVVLGTAYGAGYFYFGSHFLPAEGKRSMPDPSE